MQVTNLTTKWSLLAIAAVLLILAVGVATAVNAHGGDVGLVHACVNNNSGEVKIIDADDTCKNNESSVDWNIQGPKGDTGDSGSGTSSWLDGPGKVTTTVDVGIGLIAPSYPLDVDGIIRFQGAVIKSDARLKTNIQPITSPLDKALALRGVMFNWNPEKGYDDGTQFGLIAQEVEEVLPELVFTGSDGYKSVAYINIVPVLLEAIEELEARVAELENR